GTARQQLLSLRVRGRGLRVLGHRTCLSLVGSPVGEIGNRNATPGWVAGERWGTPWHGDGRSRSPPFIVILMGPISFTMVWRRHAVTQDDKQRAETTREDPRDDPPHRSVPGAGGAERTVGPSGHGPSQRAGHPAGPCRAPAG